MKNSLPGQNNWLNKANFITTTLFVLIINFVFTNNINAQIGPGTVLVAPPTGGFAIDGDLKANTPVTGIGDWVLGSAGTGGFLLNNSGIPVNPSVTYKLIDLWNNGSDSTFSKGKVNTDPTDKSSYTWTQTKAVGKSDMNNAFIHFTTDADGETWVIVCADRFTGGNNNSYLDIEFLHESLMMDDAFPGTFKSLGTQGGRTVGDFILAIGFSANPTFSLLQ